MLIKKILIFLFTFYVILSAWYLINNKKGNQNESFEGIITIQPVDYQNQINPDAPELKKLLKKIHNLPEAFYFVRDFVGFFPMVSDFSITATIANRYSNCLGKSILLASLYRALGVDKEDVRIVVGQIQVKDEIIEHSWVELRINNVWYQQDTTDLLGKFEFYQFPNRTYSKTFCRRENFCFNETGFAVVSQLNLFK